MSLGHRSVSEASRKGYRLRGSDEQGTRSHGATFNTPEAIAFSLNNAIATHK
jgi:hypothetical protein